MPKPQPIQPLEIDASGVRRFRANAIVRHLLDHGGIDMNAIARLDFTREDREQFAMLIGYSHTAAGDLGYVSDETWLAAQRMDVEGVSEMEARNTTLRDQLEEANEKIRAAAAALGYGDDA